MNSHLLEMKMKQKGITNLKAAEATNMDPSTFYRKKTGESDFHRSEIQILIKLLDLSLIEVEEIFFNN